MKVSERVKRRYRRLYRVRSQKLQRKKRSPKYQAWLDRYKKEKKFIPTAADWRKEVDRVYDKRDRDVAEIGYPRQETEDAIKFLDDMMRIHDAGMSASQKFVKKRKAERRAYRDEYFKRNSHRMSSWSRDKYSKYKK